MKLPKVYLHTMEEVKVMVNALRRLLPESEPDERPHVEKLIKEFKNDIKNFR